MTEKRKLDVTVAARTSAPADQVLAAARNFSEHRTKLWPNVKAQYFQVHDIGPGHADATEGIFVAGLFWERSRYEWSEFGSVKGTVTDSNVIDAGSTFELRAIPTDGGSDVEMELHRTFRNGPKGRIGGAINRLSGRRGWHSYLRRVLKNLEKEQAATTAPPR